MKNFCLLLAAIFIAITFSTNAQVRIAVQDGANATFYTDLATALNAAPAGSSVYIPGGTFDTGGFHLNKSLKIYGAGHYPENTSATGKTIINNWLFLITGADNSLISGLEFSAGIYFGDDPSNQTDTGKDSISCLICLSFSKVSTR